MNILVVLEENVKIKVPSVKNRIMLVYKCQGNSRTSWWQKWCCERGFLCMQLPTTGVRCWTNPDRLAFTGLLAASEFEHSVLYRLLLRMYYSFLRAVTEICAAHRLNRGKNNTVFKRQRYLTSLWDRHSCVAYNKLDLQLTYELNLLCQGHGSRKEVEIKQKYVWSALHKHTHTHTCVYIYIYIYILGCECHLSAVCWNTHNWCYVWISTANLRNGILKGNIPPTQCLHNSFCR